MKRDDFKLRNDHRSRALKLAVTRIDEQTCKPLYRRRDALLTKIVDEAYRVLHEASLPYRNHKEFIGAEIMSETDQLRVGSRANILLGKAIINPRHGETWPVLSSNVAKPEFIVLHYPDRPIVGLAGKTLDFSVGGRDRPSDVVPSSSLDWILNSKVRNTADSKEIIVSALHEIETKIVPAIMDAFAAVPQIVRVLADCFTYSDLVDNFPAAEELFENRAPKAEAETVKEAVTLLKKIS